MAAERSWAAIGGGSGGQRDLGGAGGSGGRLDKGQPEEWVVPTGLPSAAFSSFWWNLQSRTETLNRQQFKTHSKWDKICEIF